MGELQNLYIEISLLIVGFNLTSMMVPLIFNLRVQKARYICIWSTETCYDTYSSRAPDIWS